jgi:hypothetical protein
MKAAGSGLTLSRNTLIIIAALVVVAAVGIGLAIGLSGGGSSSSSNPKGPVDWSKLTGLQTGPYTSWNDGVANLQLNLPYLGLNDLGMQEGDALHIHQHLDVYVDGKHVTVPSQIGIFGSEFLTEMHTHDSAGIIHVESFVKKTFRLGQFFGEWGVMLTSNCLGKYCGHLHWWVNGDEQTGNPANLALSQHQEIVIAAGTPPKHIPSKFNWEAHGV